MKLLVVGDTHANPDWWIRVVVTLARELGVDGIVQVGDFGFWAYATAFIHAAAGCGIPVWFCDGNHEDHGFLKLNVDAARARAGITDPLAPVPIIGGLTFVPRGGRVRFGDVDTVFVGGARSIDRAVRTAGIDWFFEEALSNADLEAVAAGGHADVMFAHDTPSGYRIPGLVPDAQLPDFWRSELAACNEHRERVREAFDAVTPSLLIHGHYHVDYSLTLDEAWGQVQVEGLDRDGEFGAFVLLDTVGSATVTQLELAA